MHGDSAFKGLVILACNHLVDTAGCWLVAATKMMMFTNALAIHHQCTAGAGDWLPPKRKVISLGENFPTNREKLPCWLTDSQES